MYQMFLRPFTPAGTLKAAERKLPMLAELGIDIVYLCPICLQDDDMDRSGWSPRHHVSTSADPRNPYRIKDYFTVDPEYGTAQDLHDFVATAHGLGLRVLLDIVFFHCGPTAVFLNEHPAFVQREQSGEIKNGQWRFPMLNFDCTELREYLWDNLEYWLREFNVDGYRCDVASCVPLDFWDEARRRMERVNPEVIMLSEGERQAEPEFAFDMNYTFAWNNRTVLPVFAGKMPAAKLREVWEQQQRAFPEGTRFIRYTDNHDIANDAFENRPERAWGFDGMNAALTLLFTIDGIPFVYNGQEIADGGRHSIYKGVGSPIEWARADSDTGRARFALVRKLCELRHTEPALFDGALTWLDNAAPDAVVAFVRDAGEARILVVINARGEAVNTSLQLPAGETYEPLLSAGAALAGGTAALAPFGYVVAKRQQR
jgi:glycosidase